MRPPYRRRWLHPQTVPRGFLRLYILNLLSSGPESGYSIILKIQEATEGVWRPGAGTVYPLLKSLASEGLARAKGSDGRGGTKLYELTSKGRRELEGARKMMAGMGGKERVLGRLFADLLPAEVFVPMMIRRMSEATVLQRKLTELPADQRDLAMKELRLILEGQIRWVDSKLDEPSTQRNKRPN